MQNLNCQRSPLLSPKGEACPIIKPHIQKKIWIHCPIIYFTLIFVTILFTNCKYPVKQNNQTINIGTLNGPSVISMVKMIDEAIILGDSFKTNFTIKNEPNQLKALMFKNELDFAIVPTTLASLLYNKGLEYQICAIPVWGNLYLVADSGKINTWGDLNNKRIYSIAKGMTPDVVLKHLLAKNNLNYSKDIVLDYSFPNHIDLANAVSAGIADIALLPEPYVSIVLGKNKKLTRIFDLGTEWNNLSNDSVPFAQTALLVNKNFAENNKKLVNEFLEKYKESINWANNNKTEASDLLKKHNIMKGVFLTPKTIESCNLKYEFANNFSKEIMAYLKIFYDINPAIIGGKMPDEEIFYKK